MSDLYVYQTSPDPTLLLPRRTYLLLIRSHRYYFLTNHLSSLSLASAYSYAAGCVSTIPTSPTSDQTKPNAQTQIVVRYRLRSTSAKISPTNHHDRKFPLVGKSTGKRQIHCSCWDLIPSCGRIYTSYYQTTEAQGWIPTYSTGDQGRGGVAQWVGLRVPASAEGFGFGG